MINNSSSVSQGRSEGIVFGTAEELIGVFDAEYKKVPAGKWFEQGGYLENGLRGWELYVPKKIVRFVAHSDIDKLSEINFGFYGMNRAGEEGILLKVGDRMPAYPDSVFQKQVTSTKNGSSVVLTVFFSADQIILHNGESFAEFILKLGHNGDLAGMDEKGLKALLDEAKYVEPEIDNATGDITDEYKYVPLVLEIEALGSPREILHGKNWRDRNRTNKYVHTHLPTAGRWNDVISKYVHDERDELNTPPDILGLRHDMHRLNAPTGASSSIVTFNSDRTPRTLRTFMLDLLSAAEQEELLTLSQIHRMSLSSEPSEFTVEELKEIIRFYELVKKATVNGLPDSTVVS